MSACGAEAAMCLCARAADHEPPHECGHEGCGGAWTGALGTDDFAVVRFPLLGAVSPVDALCAVLGIPAEDGE